MRQPFVARPGRRRGPCPSRPTPARREFVGGRWIYCRRWREVDGDRTRRPEALSTFGETASSSGLPAAQTAQGEPRGGVGVVGLRASSRARSLRPRPIPLPRPLRRGPSQGRPAVRPEAETGGVGRPGHAPGGDGDRGSGPGPRRGRRAGAPRAPRGAMEPSLGRPARGAATVRRDALCLCVGVNPNRASGRRRRDRGRSRGRARGWVPVPFRSRSPPPAARHPSLPTSPEWSMSLQEVSRRRRLAAV